MVVFLVKTFIHSCRVIETTPRDDIRFSQKKEAALISPISMASDTPKIVLLTLAVAPEWAARCLVPKL